MARYYGDFRSLDTSNDPKGQKYRVLIFTGYDGTTPYQYNRMDFEPVDGQTPHAPIVWPIVGTPLTMTANPFTVTYEGDAENIFKPYKCSTASVSFMQSAINLDFVNNNGTSTLVFLLKWKKEVSEVNGRMYNRATGETLNKRIIQNGGQTLFEDYEPYKYDRFCYNVEWIGFSTPETFSMDYDHTRDQFTLNAQDAFSVLRYSKYETMGDAVVVPMSDILFNLVGSLGTYRKIYITDTVKFQGETVNAILSTCEQQKNNFDEDNKPNDKLTVLSQMLTYLGLTAIPWHDALILTTPNALREGWCNYNVWALPESGYIMTFGGGSYSQQPDEYISNRHTITEESHSGGTQISTVNVYNSATVKCDEYAVDMLLPDIGDNDNLGNQTYNFELLDFFASGNDHRFYYREHDYFNSNVAELKLFQYEGNPYGPGWGTAEVASPMYVDGPTVWRRPFAAVIDDGGLHQGTQADGMRQPYNPTRRLYFRTPNGYATRDNYDDKTQYWQPLLYAKTKDVVISNNQYLQITGDWRFFSSANDSFRHIPSNELISSALVNTTVVPNYCYVWAKVKCNNKWLKKSAEGYSWSNTEQCVKLYFELDTNAKAFGDTYKYARTFRNFEGIIVKLPVTGDNAIVTNVEIWFDRPLGVCSTLCECATLDGFAFNVYSEEYIASRGKSGTDKSNTEYRTEMNPQAVEEYPAIGLNLSSDRDKGIRYSQTVKTHGEGYEVMPRVYNVATSNYALPEKHLSQNIATQYGTPTINLAMDLHNLITPYTLLTWGQFPNRKFIVNSLEINYEYETAEATITEVKTAAVQSTIKQNRTRNYKRNNDLLFTAKQVALKPITIDNSIIIGTRTINGSTMTTTSEEEGNITIQPQLTEDSRLLVSVPNEVDAVPSVDNNGHLVLTFND